MATFFEMIKRVLDASYQEITDKKKDELIKTRLAELSDHYSDVLSKGGPSYSDEITRFAYVPLELSAHC